MTRDKALWALSVVGVLLTTPTLVRADAIVVTQAMRASTIAEFFIEPEAIRSRSKSA